jgi:methionyl-tRNA formyltransferase
MGKITFFLMSLKGFKSLNSFINAFGIQNIDFVVSSKDQKVENDYYNDIEQLCRKSGIPFYNRNQKFDVKSTYAFAISWRWLINLEHTKLIIFHDSLLPKYRGFAPLPTAMINGDNDIGVTALIASEEYDKGEILLQQAIKISYPLKIETAINLISECYVELMLLLSKKIISNEDIVSMPQDEKQATYSLWRDENDYSIEWSADAKFIKRFIDSVGYPYRGAFTFMNNQKVRVLDANVINDVTVELRQEGKIIFVNDGRPVVVCGKGLLQINELISDEDKTNLLPINKFRTRFQNKN